jgi:hypothetical protein
MNLLTPPIEKPDPAAQFAIASSLWHACHDHAAKTKGLNLSEIFNGMDECMRVVMHIGERFEDWACKHVNFDNLDDVWPYLLQDKFGSVCLEAMWLAGLADFNEEDCLRVALLLRLPIMVTKNLPVPVYLKAANPLIDSAFKTFRIQTFRIQTFRIQTFHRLVDDDAEEPFVSGDDPYDSNFESPFFSLYGIDEAEKEECIADRPSYDSARDLALKLAPGIEFPLEVCVMY